MTEDIRDKEPVDVDSLAGKVTIQFELPEQHQAATLALKANALSRVIWDMDQALREVERYSEVESAIADAAEWRRKLREICEDHNVNLIEDCG